MQQHTPLLIGLILPFLYQVILRQVGRVSMRDLALAGGYVQQISLSPLARDSTTLLRDTRINRWNQPQQGIFVSMRLNLLLLPETPGQAGTKAKRSHHTAPPLKYNQWSSLQNFPLPTQAAATETCGSPTGTVQTNIIKKHSKVSEN